MDISVLGGGHFGTVIAHSIAENGNPVSLWMRDESRAETTQKTRENLKYLPGLAIHPSVSITSDIKTAVESASMVFITVPSASFAEVCDSIRNIADEKAVFVSGTKGISPNGFKLMSEITAETLHTSNVGVLSGPNLAEEIAKEQLTGTVVASEKSIICDRVQDVLHSDRLRVYKSADIYGVELAGALKNIYAIICGMANGFSVGQNTIGMLLTRALAEMSRFAVAMGGNPFTFLGLAGVGDLLVTCSSPLSRNYQLGLKISRGISVDEAIGELGQLAEGVNTLQLVHSKKNDMNVYMPLVDGLHRVLFEGDEIWSVVRGLMEAPEGPDVEFADPSIWPSRQ
mgnify:FL=1